MTAIPSLPALREKLRSIFPTSLTIVAGIEASLATCATLAISDISVCPAVNLEGNSSSGKTTILNIVSGLPVAYPTDKFTAKAFVSSMQGKTSEELKTQVDLLPKLVGKVLIVYDLAPTLSTRADERGEVLGILTRVFDGQGLMIDTGVHGQRGYTGDYRFVWLAATTPFPDAIWTDTVRMGTRWLHYHLPDRSLSVEAQAQEMLQNDFAERVKSAKGAVTEFFNGLWEWCGKERGVIWPNNDNQDTARAIVRLANTVALWRSQVSAAGTDTGYALVQKENPARVRDSLWAIARGHALLRGSKAVGPEDLPLVTWLAVSTMPADRRAILRQLVSDGSIGSGAASDLTANSRPHARDKLELLGELGAGVYEPGSKGRSNEARITLREEDAHLKEFLPAAEAFALHAQAPPVK